MKIEKIVLHQGDCLSVLGSISDCSVDSIVTDPPYGLSFMGKRWDYDVPAQAVWEECLRVLKPGGHLLAFAGTRTQHRMAVRIEDAGFEIRDMIAWVYGSGMPKSFNLDRLQGDKVCGCSFPYTQNGAKQKTECDVRRLRQSNVSPPQSIAEECGEILQSSLQEQGSSAYWEANRPGEYEGCEQSSMEGWRDAPEAPRELCAGQVCEGTSGCCTDGSQGRVCHGASLGDGEMDRSDATACGSGSSRRPRSTKQCAPELGAVAGQSQPQAMGAWPICGGCGLPRIPSGLGTALKPALEPITVARKTLVGTVAENVLAHGTGALNIDGCRVGDEVRYNAPAGNKAGGSSLNMSAAGMPQDADGRTVAGRWPANLIHDGSDEVLAGFPVTTSGVKAGGQYARGTGVHEGGQRLDGTACYGDTGSAARFFYAAKASKKDRGDGNAHPTVKPTDLMRYLCRLVTPPGGTVLDPFMGSGSTGKAAMLEGFQFIGIEREGEYLNIARHRIFAAYQSAANEETESKQMELIRGEYNGQEGYRIDAGRAEKTS